MRVGRTIRLASRFLSIVVALAAARVYAGADPELRIPTCARAPVIDGKMGADEWRLAAGAGMLEWGAVREGQASFFVCRDAENLYVAMVSIDSNTNGIVARSVMHDNRGICGDDAVEIMIAPGTAEDVKRYDFPAFYIVVNSIGTVWDCKFVPLLNEEHMGWESGAEVANGVDGTYWCCEMRIPFSSIGKERPKDGDVWRMNFDRTFSGYRYAAWKTGSLNDGRVGGNVTFDGSSAVARVLAFDQLLEGALGVSVEVANPTGAARTVKLSLECAGRAGKDGTETLVGRDAKEVKVPPGGVEEVKLGRGQKLAAANTLRLEAADADGQRLLAFERTINIPVQRLVRTKAPAVQLVHVFPRFIASQDRLAVLIDYTAWSKKTGYSGPSPVADVKVWRKGAEGAAPALAGTLAEFADGRGTWRASTAGLPEGEYTVKATVRSRQGEVLAVHDDWFEKRIFEWMKEPRGTGDEVPALYEPLKVEGADVRMYGRRYRFGAAGLPAGVSSQGKDLLLGGAELIAEIGGRPVPVVPAEAFRVVRAAPAKVEGRAVLTAGGLRMTLSSMLEYDGFLLYRLTYEPSGAPVPISRLRVRVPLAAARARFYSAAGDTNGTCIQADVLPAKTGRVYDSMNDTYSVCCSPTFATLFWTGDYDTCFCYAADSDKGWLIRDDAPAVEAHREGDALVLWLNLVDKPWDLKGPRTLEFAFQAGPTKALPEAWRGVQCHGDPDDAPLTFSLMPSSGAGYTMAGGTHFMHPGTTPAQREKSRAMVEKQMAGGKKLFGGYHWWGHATKGFPETRVFRSEWGIDREAWESAVKPRPWEWENRLFGDDKDLCIIMTVNAVPSYVDFCTYAYDETLKHTALCGFYDDTGYPKPVYDEELGLGFVREDGRKIYSSGLWIYRERWKRAAYVNHVYKRPNYLWDSQHAFAHFLPAYNFIGVWAPCERGYYNPFKGGDNLDFYRSVERYAAFNPARQFGQIPMVGMSSPAGGDKAVFARDTRNMMMLAFLHDQDVGSWGHRDRAVVVSLRRARNLVRPWEKGVSFAGYWENAALVKTAGTGVLASVYARPEGALFIVGNTGAGDAAAVVEPAWRALKLDPRALKAVDAETGEPVALSAGASGTGFGVTVPRHDVRLVFVSRPVK